MPKRSNGPPLLERAAGAGPTNTRRSGAVSASGVQANGAALGPSVAEPRSARSRNMPLGCNSRTHRLSRSLPPGATAAWVASASQCPSGSISGEPGITSAGNSTSSVESGSLPASFRAMASTRKMRERTGGPAWRVVTTNRNPSGVHATPAIRSGTLECAGPLGVAGSSKMRRGGRLASSDATHTASEWPPGCACTGVSPLTGHRLVVTAAAEPGVT